MSAERGRAGIVTRCVSLLSETHRTRAPLVVAMAAGVGFLEAVSALLILFLLKLITDADGAAELPIVGDVRDALGNPSDERFITIVAVGLGAFFLIRAGCVLGQTYVQQRICHNAGVDLSSRLVARYLAMPFVEHQRRNSAELVRNAYTSVTEVVVYAFLPLVMMLSEALVVAAIMIVLLVSAPLATLAAVAVLGPAVLVLVRTVRPRLTAIGAESQAAASDSLRTLDETLAGIRDLTVLEVRDHFHKRFESARRRFAQTQYVRTTVIEIPRLAVETFAMLFILGFLAVSAGSAEAGDDSMIVLGLFAYAVLRVMPSVNRIVSNLNTLRSGQAAVDNVIADLELPIAHPPRAGGASFTFERAIELEGVRYRYPDGDRDVLVDIDLTIPRGASLGIVGPTGGGKSTLLDVLLGLLEPTHGSVRVDGVDIRDGIERWHQLLGVVPQVLFLVDDTLRRNIALGVPDDEIDEAAVAEAVGLAQLQDTIDAMPDGLDTVVGERGARLSGGQRQRVAIARALYRRPSVLIFDEGTSALDNRTEAEVVRAIARLKGERTVVTVAHRLTTVRPCDRIIVLADGRIDDAGTFEELDDRHPAFRTPD